MARLEILNKLQSIFRTIFEDEMLIINEETIHSEMEEWNSFEHTNMLALIEHLFEIRLSTEAVLSCRSIGDMVTMIEGDLVKRSATPPILEQVAFKENNPASSVQERMYALYSMNSDRLDYNITFSLVMEGELCTARLQEALNRCLVCNPMLRTNFYPIHGALYYRIRSDVQLEIEKVRYEIENRESFEQVRKNEVSWFIKPFQLATDELLMRAKLINYRDEKYLLLLDFHHIIFDRASLSVFLHDLQAFYNHPDRQVEKKYNYGDFVNWQRQYVASDEYAKKQNYWTEVLSTETSLCDLLVDYPHKRGGLLASDSYRVELFNYQEIDEFCRSYEITKYTFFTGIFAFVLAKLTFQSDITIGTFVSGRHHFKKELNSIIGMFVNTLPIRNNVAEDWRFCDFLISVQKNIRLALKNSDVLYETILDISANKKNSPLFDVCLNYIESPHNILKLDHVSCFVEYEMPHDCAYNLTLLVNARHDSFEILVHYAKDLYRKSTIGQMLALFIETIDHVLDNQIILVKNIPISSLADQTKILKEFNDTVVDYPGDKTVVQLFEEQVKKNPEHIAVVFAGEQVTYKELNERANILAYQLRKLGVEPDDYVAIIAERSLEVVVGICGIIKAGGAYVPIDPTYPADRIQYMLEDCCPKAVLTYQMKIDTLVPTLDLNEAQAWEGAYGNPVHVNQPEDLIYLIYTSGTTGKPKEVMVEHKSVIRLVKYPNYIHLDEETVILQTGDMSFDASTFEIWGALLNGGKLILTEREVITDAKKLKVALERSAVNTMWVTSTLFNQLIQMKETLFDGLKYLLIGGEKLSVDHVKMLKDRDNKVTVINGYGPTENTTFTATYEIPKHFEMIPIGRPIGGTQVYILVEQQLCGIGVVGELCIAGDGLARGYLNQPELVAEKFIENLYGAGRLYRTGDLARWLPDGNIEYLGRMDEQVKVRGFRIELAEIESAIREIEVIKDCVVIVGKEGPSGDEQAMYGYVVSDTEVSMSLVRESLMKILPDYMIPSYMAQIDAIPLTKNGKLDKRALPAIKARTEQEYVAPMTELEEKLCSLFEDTLSVEQVGIKDNFFELGGHSLRATRLVNRIEVETGVRIALKEVFGNPTVAALSELLIAAEGSTYMSIPKAEVKEYYGMSSAQKRIYLIQEMDLEAVTYNMPQYLKLTGEVRPEGIKRALQELINRHEILRTEFTMLDGELVQRVREAVEVDFEYVSEVQEKEEQAMKELVKPFDLGKPSQLRAKLIKMDSYHLFMLDMHHIISDGMSMSTFINEFTEVYNGKSLEALTHQFKDYSEWMRSRDLSEQKEYWLKEFSDEIPVLDMPLDYVRPKERCFVGTMISLEIDQELGGKIKALAKETESTEYMIFLASAMVLLGKYANQEDVVIGSPISGRTHRDTEQMLGMFVNTLAMRGRPEKEKSFERLLAEVKRSSLRAYENQEYPFEELVEAVEIRRDLSRNPLFDVMLAMQNNEETKYEMNNITSEYIGVGSLVAKFDLTFNIWEIEGNYGISLEYCTALFKEETVELMLAHYVELLHNLLEKPAAKLKEVSMITKDEQRLIIEKFNNTNIDYPRDATVVQLFEDQVKQTPEKIAVFSHEQQLTYQELNKRANALAYKLRDLGVGPDDYVAIMSERSTLMIIGIYGIIKAGGAYVAIDPTYPKDRINYILEDCEPKVVLTHQTEVETLIPVVDLGAVALWEGVCENPVYLNKAEDLIYLIYTSGTTGKPKGVMIEHKSVIRLVKSTNYINLDEETVILQTGAMSFDASTFEIWGTFLNGGKLVLADREEITDAKKLKMALEENAINTMWMTSTLFNQLIQMNETLFDGLKYVLIGGERLSVDHVKILKDRDNKVTVINGYGPTENTTFTTTYEIPKRFEMIPIGRPIGGTQVYILTEHQLCGIGVVGELCIAGDGLARGYLKRPELTNSKFIDNPYGEGKLYRTGDLARWLPDGNIEYLGRMDEQVKIRGFRVELGEIESAIREIEVVKDCAVILGGGSSDDQAIYGYVVSDTKISLSLVRESLMKTLPDYMIPAYMAQIDAIPLTKNGKLDKRALPEIEAKTEQEYVAPRTELEEKICLIFEEILGVPHVGIKDSFFELGGHSLRATRLVNRIESEMSVKVVLKKVFKDPTVAALAEVVEEAKENEYACIPKAEEKDGYEMSSAQKRIYLIGEMNPEAVTYNMPQYLRLTGEVHPKRIKRALQALVDRHEILRTAFMMVEGNFLQRIEERVMVDFEYVSEIQRDEEEWMLEFIKPFDLSKASQLRSKLINMGSYYLLMIDMHHIISDGMSMGTFIYEFTQLYNGKRLAKLTHQFKDYSEWMKSRDLSHQQAYWIEEFSDGVPVLDLPLDYARPKEQSFEGATTRIEVKLGRQIKALAKQTETTEYMVFLAAAMVLLGAYANQEDIVVGSPINGRTHRDTEALLGMFVNTLAMRGRPEKEKNFVQLLTEVKQSSLKAYEFQDYPFEELVEQLDIRRDLSRNPLFDVMLVMQNNEAFEYRMDGVSSETIELESRVAKFDLTFHIWEREEDYRITLEYCTALFKKELAEWMLEHYRELLRNLLERPHIKLKEVGMITEAMQRQIIEKFNDTEVAYPKEKTVIQLFEEQVEKTPQSIAVLFEEEQLTYKELNERANILAYQLRKLGVGSGDYVAIIAERSLEVVVGICGIIKAGGAYVPIDPTYPADRIQYMLEDCCPKAVLTYQTKVDTLAPTLDLKEAQAWEGMCENPVYVNQPEDLIYLIYTSGTTGKPKGVMVEHKSVIRLVKYPNYVHLDEETVILQTGAISFDASSFELWGAFLNGGRVVLLPEDILLNATLLKEEIIRNGVNTMFLTTAFYNQLISLDASLFDPLRQLLFGGEATSEEHVRKLVNRKKELSFSNVYGPTENTTFSLHYPITHQTLKEKTPIGKPIGGTQAYILNGDVLCGIGVPGELCLAGDGVARGYLNRPELTAQKFVTYPHGSGRLYRTGDLARWLPDGNIEYLGRLDEQIKIRGFRIELGEIESALQELEEIKRCAVITKEDIKGETAIYAYVVSDAKLDIQQIKDSLVKRLPDYMIPSYMTQIESIPVTRNGKLDKGALPEIKARAVEYVAPRTELEVRFCALFEEILAARQVGIKDSFFELGGHSLRAMRLINRMEAETGVRIALKEVFSNSTVEALSKLVAEAKKSSYSPIPKAEKKEYYEMSSAQKRIYLIGEMNPKSIAYNMPQYLKLIGKVCSERIEEALQGLVNRHEILRTAFMMLEGDLVQCIQEEVEVDFEYVSELQGNEEQMMLDFVKPFDLGMASQLRAQLINQGAYHLLMIDMHHIISDGMSMVTFINEFTEIYNGKTLEGLTHQFKDYSEWMRSRDLSHQQAYWVEVFSDEIPVLDLPLDYLRPKEQSFIGAMARIKACKKLGSQVRALAKQTGTTEYMIFLAAAMVLLGAYANQEDIVIGSPISGRTHQDTEQMLGMFVGTLAMRGRPEKEKSFVQLLAEVKQSSLKAYEFQDYPFEELVESVDIRRDLSRNPLFDVMLVMQNNEGTEYRMDGVSSESIELESRLAKFDLTFHIWEVEGSYEIVLEYGKALFKKETVEWMLKHYVELLNNLLKKPNVKLKEASMITEFEQHFIREDFNDTAVEYLKEQTVVQLFEEQVRRTPNQIAIVFEEEQLTYRELNERANILAHRLRKLGVKPGDYVAIMAERSLEMTVGIYGIIKSGGAYVPVDPTYPADRIQYMLADCHPKAILTYQAEVETFIPVIDLSDVDAWEGVPENPVCVHQAEDLIYLIYTSGTTGKPKGVVITHEAVCNTLQEINAKFRVTARDNVLGLSSIAFDLSVYDILGTLLTGASLYIVPDLHDVPGIEALIKEKGITLWNSVPSIMQMYLDETEPYAPSDHDHNTLRLVMLSGDWIPLSIPDRIKKAFPGVEVISLGGATEASIWSIYYPIKEVSPLWSSIPYGRPLANQTLYVLDSQDELCPFGIEGNICIGGQGLAVGYLNDPVKTNEAFFIHPEYGRLYRTGDNGIMHPEGYIEFRGRKDHQVKIRGFRIELGEIEHALQGQEVIKDCAVIVREDGRGYPNKEKAIYAYLVSDMELNMSWIRDSLMKSLPDYMIPTYITQIESMPLTRSGKLDKQALPEIEVRTERAYVAPRCATEELIVRTFKTILGLEKVGIMDNLFELGGDSIKALRMVALANDPRLSVRVILAEKTPKRIAAKMRDPFSEGIISLMNHGDKDSPQPQLFLIPSGAGFSSEFNALVHEMKYGGTIYGINDPKLYVPNPSKLDDPNAYTVMQIFNEIERIFRDGDILIGFSYGGRLLPILSSLLEKAGKKISKAIVLDTIINLSEESYRENEIDMSLELAKTYVQKYTTKEYTIEEFGITSEKILKKVALILSGNTGESVERTYQELRLAHEVYLINVKDNVRFRSKIATDIVGIFTTRLMREFSEKVLEWGNYTKGSYTYEILDCEHTEIITSHANQIANLLMEFIRRE